MEQSSPPLPSADACAELLRTLPALAALKRTARQVMPPESQGWLGALATIRRRPGGLRLRQVAELLHVDMSVASRQVSQLEGLGYARREPDPTDGRASLLHATDAGREYMAAAMERFAAHIREFLGGWSDDEILDLATQLDRLSASLEVADRRRPAAASTDTVTDQTTTTGATTA